MDTRLAERLAAAVEDCRVLQQGKHAPAPAYVLLYR